MTLKNIMQNNNKKVTQILHTVFTGHSSKQKSNSNRQQIKWLPGITGRWQRAKLTAKTYQGTFWVMEMFYILFLMAVTLLCMFVRTHPSVLLKQVPCTICKL